MYVIYGVVVTVILIGWILNKLDKNKPSIVFTIILHFLISLEAWSSIFFLLISVNSSNNSHDTFEQQKNVIQ